MAAGFISKAVASNHRAFRLPDAARYEILPTFCSSKYAAVRIKAVAEVGSHRRNRDEIIRRHQMGDGCVDHSLQARFICRTGCLVVQAEFVLHIIDPVLTLLLLISSSLPIFDVVGIGLALWKHVP